MMNYTDEYGKYLSSKAELWEAFKTHMYETESAKVKIKNINYKISGLVSFLIGISYSLVF